MIPFLKKRVEKNLKTIRIPMNCSHWFLEILRRLGKIFFNKKKEDLKTIRDNWNNIGVVFNFNIIWKGKTFEMFHT